MTIPPNGDNIGTITDANTFRVWFDSTNRLITKLNPLEFYSITAGSGEVAGITIDLNRTTGAAIVGLDLPVHITGPHKFGGGITFENEVRVSGSTVDFGGATLFGQIVRSVNGLTGDLQLDIVGLGLPSDIAHGDILVYSPNGSTMEPYRLFTGQTFDQNGFFRFGGSGGLELGTGDAGPLGAVNNNRQAGNIELLGTTGAMVAYHDVSYNYGAGAPNEEGSFYYFGRINGRSNDNMGVVITGGGSTTGFETNTNAPYVVIDQTSREMGLFGITSPNAPIHYKSRSLGVGRAGDMILEDTSGVTLAVRMYPASIAKNNEGIFTETLPRDKGFRTLPSARFITSSDIDSIGFDIMASDNAAKGNFTVFGEPATGISLAPVLNVRNTGDVVIGGITASDGGSTYGTLNLASGKLLLGGDAGFTFSSGVQVVASNGVSAGYKVMFPNALLNEETTLEQEINLTDFRLSAFGDQSDTIMVGPLDNQRQYLGHGGVGLATNETVRYDILPTDMCHFTRLATSAGVTYTPALSEFFQANNPSHYIKYNGEETTTDANADTAEIRNLLTGRSGNPYDRIICFKNNQGENLVGDFTITLQTPPADHDQTGGSNRARSKIMGVAVFVDMDDDVLLGLTLGCSAESIDHITGFTNGDTLKGDGTSKFYMGNPKGNLNMQTMDDGEEGGEPSNGVQFMDPKGIRGGIDPALNVGMQIGKGGNMTNAEKGTLIPQIFKFSGTAKRRVQILPFCSIAPDRAGELNQQTGEIVDGFNPFGEIITSNDDTQSRGYKFNGGGFVHAEFKQVEA